MNDNAANGATPRPLPDLTKTNPEQWQAFSLELIREVDRLRSEIQMLRTQRRELLDLLVPDRHKYYEIDEKIFEEMEMSPSIQEIIAHHGQSRGQ